MRAITIDAIEASCTRCEESIRFSIRQQIDGLLEIKPFNCSRCGCDYRGTYQIELRPCGVPARVYAEAPSGPAFRPQFRKPLAKDADKTLMATKPWEAEGISRRTWYRRQEGPAK